MSLTIRPARRGDAPLVLTFVRELAAFEKLEHEVEASAQMLDDALFAPTPRVFCDIAEWEGEPVGMALWLYDFSTFRGVHGIWLEDLFVREAARGRGIGRALLAHLARRCRDEGLARLDWWVLDWNAASIGFYRALGAIPMEDWTVFRLTDAPLARLADDI